MNLKEKLDAYNAQRITLLQEIREDLPSMFTEFFEQNPLAHSIEWTQYTPYFNDGDACEFTLSEVYVTFGNAEEVEELGYADDDHMLAYGDYSYLKSFVDYREGKKVYYSYADELEESPTLKLLNEMPIEDLKAMFQRAKGVISQVHQLEGFLEALFDGNARVKITRTGIEVDDYESPY